MNNTRTNVRNGTTLVTNQTHTTREGFTTLAKTDNEAVNTALEYFEDGLSGVYYHAMGRDNVGEDPLDFAIAYLEGGLAALKALRDE